MMKKTWPVICGRGRRKRALVVPLMIWSVVALMACWRLSRSFRELVPRIEDQESSFAHLRRCRSLRHYLENIKLLIEPASPPCTNVEEVPVIVLVPSAPKRLEQRKAIRDTWAKHQPTYFLVGLDPQHSDEQLIDNYIEAKQHNDLVVYDFHDHYQNLTLKTALMMQWTLARCPQAEFLYKVDDDVMVNPWMLKTVLKENENAKFLGYALNNTLTYREQHSKWYLPRWLFSEDVIPQFLSGPGYIINGDYIRIIIRAAYQVPLINNEDVYYTHLVAKSLKFKVTHDSRLAPYRPWPSWLPISCAYWVQVSIHSLLPQEFVRIWSRISTLGKEYETNKDVCYFYKQFVHRFVHFY